MWIDRLGLARLRRECAAAAVKEETAGYELALSARRFSRRTRRDADDKLAFSATLMRAGEAAAATRLISDFERDVRAHRELLARRVDEARAAGATRRSKMTRLRLARLFAAALLAAALVAGSLGATMTTGLFVQPARGDARPVNSPAAGAPVTGFASLERAANRRDKVESVAMTTGLFRNFRSPAPTGSAPGLEELLLEVLEQDPDLGARVTGLLARASGRAVPDIASIGPAASGLATDLQEEGEWSPSGIPDETGGHDVEPAPVETEGLPSDGDGGGDAGAAGEEPDDSGSVDPSTAGT